MNPSSCSPPVLAIRCPACLFCLLIALLGASGCRDSNGNAKAPPTTNGGSEEDPAEQLRLAVEARDWRRALELAEPAMIRHPDDASVLTNVAVAKGSSGAQEEAAALLVEAAKAEDFAPGLRVENAIRALFQVGQLHDAIDLLEQVLARHPDATDCRRQLVGFLGEAQLTEEVDSHLQRLIRDRQFDLPLLLATTESSSRRYSDSTINALLKLNPDDLRPRLGQAKTALASRDAEQATKVLREIVERHPDFAAAQAMLGAALVASGKLGELPEWFSKLPPGADRYSGYWTAVGNWALESGQTSGAVRAFAEASRRSPNDSSLWARLASATRKLHSEGPTPAAGQQEMVAGDLEAITAGIDRRMKGLLELQVSFAEFRRGNYRSQSDAVDVAAKLLDLGRIWEAEAWLAISTQLPDDPSESAAELRQQAVARLSADRDWLSRKGSPELEFELDAFPLPQGLAGGELSTGQLAGKSVWMPLAEPLTIRMADEAAKRRLNFYAEIGDGVEGPRVPIYQTLGCGGGTIDIDQDGRHDIVFVAAGGRMRQLDSEPGALFLNRGSYFHNVSSPSGFADRGFGSGVAVGDYNDDGFPDILVLNFGLNGLWRNNGDGTFTDASELLAESGAGDWSTSGAIADVDGDGYNDFVVVNYCDADEPLEAPCFDSEGREVNCYPLRYKAGRDRFLKGVPDGTFRDVTEEWAQQPSPGRGLGIVVGRLDGTRQGVYVVNDASINHFYRVRDDLSTEGAGDRLIDAGIASGLAVDAQSLDQGSMGVASADFDNDGDLDFYVTGFSQEYNIYYDQQSAGTWSDRTASLGLISATRDFVGFGTEAIDLDNDGTLELLIANGHIGDFPQGSSPYAQSMQLFRRSGNGYAATDFARWDRYFTKPHVGRALFTCDVNQDGRIDTVVTHATEPVALLVNHSEQKYGRVVLRLIDTDRARDAVGTTVRFEITSGLQDQQRHLFRLAGDGYLCSNQGELFCGTASANSIRDVRVTWPDGTTQTVSDLTTNAEYLIVRGEEPFQLRSYAK